MSDDVSVSVTVQTGNLVTPPKEDGTPGEWAVTQEWKLSLPSSLTSEALTEAVSKQCAGGKKMWPHEIQVLVGGDVKPTVLRQGKNEKLTELGIRDGTVLRFWNGKWAV